MSKIVPSSSKGMVILVSPKKVKQISPSRHWCFTLNNYTKEHIHTISSNSSNYSYIFQEETGENGTPHLQGYIDFKKKVRPKNIFDIITIHWEKCRNIKKSIEYCHKLETRTGEIYSNFYKPLKLIKPSQFYKWQKKIIKKIGEEPDDRHIYWYWEATGGVGKTAFQKYLCATYNCLMLSGKATDMKFGVVSYIKLNGFAPDIIVINIPRSVDINFLSFTGIEEVKDGLFFSPKYESGMCSYNRPHMFIFSNEKPDKGKLSLDKWRVRRIK